MKDEGKRQEERPIGPNDQIDGMGFDGGFSDLTPNELERRNTRRFEVVSVDLDVL